MLAGEDTLSLRAARLCTAAVTRLASAAWAPWVRVLRQDGWSRPGASQLAEKILPADAMQTGGEAACVELVEMVSVSGVDGVGLAEVE